MADRISPAIIKRLPRYYRVISHLDSEGRSKVSSSAIAQMMDITASQVRQDFCNFGGFGQQGYGYNVAELRREIAHILGLDNMRKIILIGAGNLGRAITMHVDFQKYGYELIGIFDSNIAMEGIEIAGISILHTNRLKAFCEENRPQMAVLCIPRSGAKDAVMSLMSYGVKAFWNFSHYDINFDFPEADVENVHLTDSLMTLSYTAKNHAERDSEE